MRRPSSTPPSCRITCSAATLKNMTSVSQTASRQRHFLVNIKTEQCFCLLLELRSDSDKKSEIDSLKMEISSLKEHIVRQQQDLQAKTAQVGSDLLTFSFLIVTVSQKYGNFLLSYQVLLFIFPFKRSTSNI